MRIGAIVPTTGELPRSLGLSAMAQTAEAAGAESLCVADHLLMVAHESSDYPYSADGRPTWDKREDYYEAFVCCSFMAAATRSCRIGTAVLILPQRGVLEVAKVAASIDQLSGGRLFLGVGVGWYQDEMEALGFDYQRRGARFDEMLQVLRECWSGTPSQFAGQHVDVPSGVVLHPPPAQAGGPPLLVGGMSDPALRHAARYGDGWLALAFVYKLELDVLRERLATLDALREGGGPPLAKVLKLHARAEDADELPDAVVALGELGFDEIMVEPPWERGLDAAGETIAAVRSALERHD
jgi:probable F420-dependent oxidoreductase